MTAQTYDLHDDEFSDSPGDIVRRCPGTFPRNGRPADCAGPLIREEGYDERLHGVDFVCARCGACWAKEDIHPPNDRGDE